MIHIALNYITYVSDLYTLPTFLAVTTAVVNLLVREPKHLP